MSVYRLGIAVGEVSGKVESLRYDAAIIGAGADGLAAAATLAKSGLKVIVLECNDQPGGRCVTREFHPGFHASPFCDELPPILAGIFWSLDLARHGAVFMPSPVSTSLWPDRALGIHHHESGVRAQSQSLVAAALRRAETQIAPRRRRFFGSRWTENIAVWPGDPWATSSLSDVVAASFAHEDAAASAIADALHGRAAHPDLAGSALHLLSPGSGGSGLVAGGLQHLANALVSAALSAGAEISCGLEVTDVRCRGGKIASARLADGTEITARAIISTLDLKRTFLSLFTWSDLPKEVSGHAGSFRMAGGTARLLFALDRLPEKPSFAEKDVFAGPIHLEPGMNKHGVVYAAWRAGTVAKDLPVALRFISVTDPRSCPMGAATMTATVGGVPVRLFDGSWTHEKREALREQVLTQVERVLPGIAARVRACDVIVPPDFEEALGCTDGDLWGGEIASDQMLGFRPWFGCVPPRTPIGGLYLAGPSTSAGILGTCVAGVFAARAIAADLEAGVLK
jgi:phytoene dehydrogenase-like protein